jgi:type 2 lantibiotic biosynthesis protein LanM
MNGGLALHISDPVSPNKKNPITRNIRHSNFPYLNEKIGDPNEYVDEIISGFMAYSNFLVQIRDKLGSDYIFQRFTKLKVRRVFRPTRFYGLLLKRLKKNIHIQDVALWSTEADFVSRFINWDGDSDSKMSVYKAERDALLELNIPIFFVNTDSTDLFTSYQYVKSFEGKTGLERAFNRLQTLNDQEIDRQVEIIEISFGVKHRDYQAKNSLIKPYERLNLNENAKLQDFFNETEQIAGFINSLKIESEDSVSWIGLDWFGNVNVAQLQPLRSDLYSGSLGISVFLAAFSKVSGDDKYLEMLIKSVQYTKHQLYSKNAVRLASNMGIGGSIGIGSVIYGLTVLADLTNMTSFLEDAMAGSKLITSKLISVDETLDVFSGTSGAILSLLALRERVREPELLEKAIQAGEHLIKKLSDRNLDYSIDGGLMLNGMSHGYAGISYALSRLGNESGMSEFSKFAKKLIVLENKTYCKTHHNWPDFRIGMYSNNNWSCQWCHGATGIALARIGTVQKGKHTPIGPVYNDINAAILKVKELPSNLSDSLCCGYLGNIELLKEASKFFNRPELTDDAINLLYLRYLHKEAIGSYQWECGPSKYNIGLFKGLAGVGYTMLRMIDAELPNILIWE